MKIENDNLDICDIHHNHEYIQVSPMPTEEIILGLSDLFKAFGDPTRVRILYTLSAGELCVCDIAAVLNMTQSAISHQLRILKACRLVTFRREGKTVFYSLADSHVETILKQGLQHVYE